MTPFRFAPVFLFTSIFASSFLSLGCEAETKALPGTTGSENEEDGSTSEEEDANPSSDAGAKKDASSAKPPVTVRIANYNVKNLYNDVIDSPEVFSEADYTPTTNAYKSHLQALAQTIAQLSADILVLEEVENMNALSDLASQSELGGKYTEKALLPGNDPRGIDVAILSKYPITKTVSHRDDKFAGDTGSGYRYSRDCLEAYLDVSGHPLALLGIHFRSQITSGSSLDEDDKRLAEGRRTRAIADSIVASSPNLPLLVLGDFNDVPGSNVVNAVKGSSPAYSNAVSLLPASDAWTVSFSGKKRIYDDQWANPTLTQFRDTASIKVLRSTASDHAPVAASYTLK